MLMRNIRAAIMAMCAALLCGAAFAQPTPGGTIITTTGKISADNASIHTDNLAHTTAQAATSVVSIYGVQLDYETPDLTAPAGTTADYTFSFENYSNDAAADSIRVELGARSYGAGAGTTAQWSAQIDDNVPFVSGLTWANSGTADAAAGGDYVTAALGPAQRATYTIRITSAPDATDGATMTASLQIQTLSSPASMYVGYNGNGYGGLAVAQRTAGLPGTAELMTTTVNGATISVVKAAAVTSPAQYQALGGGAAAAVPGARITYTITYGNAGASPALGVSIVDSLPAQTTYRPGTITTSKFGAMTDAADADECEYNGVARTITCDIGDIAAGETGRTIQYEASID